MLAITKGQHVIDANRTYFSVAVRFVDENAPVRHDGVVHGVPVGAEFTSNLGDRPTGSADLLGRRRPRPCGHDLARMDDAIITNGP